MFLSCSHTCFLIAESIGVGEVYTKAKDFNEKGFIFEPVMKNKSRKLLMEIKMDSFTAKSRLASKHSLAQSSLIDRFALQISV